jgi:predicted AAA+ superfamily ATPase
VQRELYTDLLAWKASPSRKPLILRGARQVGKTWLLKTFGKQEYAHCVYLNFEEDPRLSDFFQEKINPQTILNNLGLYLNITIHPENTLIIFDEVQESTAALNSLKYFQEQANEFDVIASGSLLGVKLGQAKGFPVGKVTFLDLLPLSFIEFLHAIGQEKLANHLLQISKTKNIETLPGPIHEELLSLLKKYMIVGGMPEAVKNYVANQDFVSVRKIQQDILDAYLLDFSKHAPKELIMKLTSVWDSLPAQLAKESKKFKWSDIHENARAREYEATVEWLNDAGLIYRSYLVTVPKFPLSAYKEKSSFKIFLIDVGLLGAMSRLSPQIILDGNTLFTEFKGAFTENVIAQMLKVRQLPLYYWASEGRAEIDFLLELENTIYPMEVKAGSSTKKKSLLVFAEKFHPTLLLRASLMNLKKDGGLLNIPLYLAGLLP